MITFVLAFRSQIWNRQIDHNICLINQIIILIGLSNLRGSHISILLVWFIQTVIQIYMHSSRVLLQYWYLPIYYFSLMYMCKMWNALNCVEVKKELDQMSLFKDILDNSEESVIIVNNN